MTETKNGRFRRLSWTVVGALALVAAVPIAGIAAHVFDDVPDSNEFHGSIAWLQDNEVTIGCNPPDNTQFCPQDNITREQMASFMRRFAQTLGNTGVQVTDPADTVVSTGTTPVELSTLAVTPKAEAQVTLNAHVTLTKATDTAGTYEVFIASGSCDDTGETVGTTSWTGAVNTEDTEEAVTVSVTGSDVVSADTDYVLCLSATDTAPDATASTRGVTANWSPVS